MSAEKLRQAAALMRSRAEAATPGPWFYDSYSTVFSAPMIAANEEFWTEEREADEHTYDNRLGQTCPACGERPAIYGETARPEVRGQPYWDCALHSEAYEVEPWAARVPPLMGDTAKGRHAATAAHIASWHPAVALAVADWLDDLYGRITDTDYDEDDALAAALRGEVDVADWPEVHRALAVAAAFLGDQP